MVPVTGSLATLAVAAQLVADKEKMALQIAAEKEKLDREAQLREKEMAFNLEKLNTEKLLKEKELENNFKMSPEHKPPSSIHNL